MTSGGNHFDYFSENQLTKFKICSPNFLIFVSVRISVTHFASLGVPLDVPALSPFPFHTPLPFVSPLTQLGDLGERCKLPSGSGQSPVTKRIFGAFRGKK